MTRFNTPTTLNDSMKNTDLKLLASRVMPDGAMALAIEYQGEIVVTRMYLTEMVAFIHHNHMRRDHPMFTGQQDDRARFRMEILSKDYYVMSKAQFQESNYHQAIPDYRTVPALEYKG